MAHNIQRPKRKSLLLWGFLLIFWFLLPLTWKVATKSSFEEFHAPVWEASTRIQDLTHFWGHVSDSKKTLIEKGRDHQRILADAKHQISSIDHLEGQGILYDIPADVIIPKGNDIQVVSSNLSGTYPKGLHIGIISELTPSVDGVFKVGKVLLSPQLSLLSEVTILKYSNAK